MISSHMGDAKTTLKKLYDETDLVALTIRGVVAMIEREYLPEGKDNEQAQELRTWLDALEKQTKEACDSIHQSLSKYDREIDESIMQFEQKVGDLQDQVEELPQNYEENYRRAYADGYAYAVNILDKLLYHGHKGFASLHLMQDYFLNLQLWNESTLTENGAQPPFRFPPTPLVEESQSTA